MPRGANNPKPGKIQTLQEARRAYQKAGRTRTHTAAQIRAAERAVEADRRAAEILAREKRGREAKRKRTELEARQREEKVKLVQAGQLPEESLWGKVRSSQPRLHDFFGGRQSAQTEKEAAPQPIYAGVFPDRDSGATAAGNIGSQGAPRCSAGNRLRYHILRRGTMLQDGTHS